MTSKFAKGFQGWKEFLKLEISQMINQAKGKGLSKDFFQLVKQIGESKSKQEEDMIIRGEVKILKSEITLPENSKKMPEYLIRLIYCEMFGFPVEFGYIEAVNLTQSTKLSDKRIGYLACCTFLHPDHNLQMLVVNSIRKDLLKDNYIEICAALTTATKLINKDTIPAILSQVIQLLDHDKPIVRKKAVMAMHKFYLLQNDIIQPYDDKIRNCLCDRDPSVMAATLCLYEDLVEKSPEEHKDLAPSFVSILKQISEGRLSKEYTYHRVPAPWFQIKILKILAFLGKDDKKTSEHIYTSLYECMKRSDMGMNAGYAIVYECVKTAANIFPNSQILDQAATSVTRFLTSSNHNLKYLGITALSLIVQINPKYANEHQLVVVSCLEDSDETLKRKTLDLLYKMTNPLNVKFIVEKLLSHLKTTNDNYLRQELVDRIRELAEKFSPDNEWFITTMNSLFLISGDVVKPEAIHYLLQLIAMGAYVEGQEEDEEADEELRRYAVQSYIKLLETSKLSKLHDSLLRVIAWVLGEYGYLSKTCTREDIIDKLLECTNQPIEHETRAWIITAIAKIIAQLRGEGSEYLPPQVTTLIEKFKNSNSLDIQQRCYEFEKLIQTPDLIYELLPENAFNEELDQDNEMQSMSFLDEFVKKSISNGAAPYVPQTKRKTIGFKAVSREFNFTPYQDPTSKSSEPEEIDIGKLELTPIATTIKDIYGDQVQNVWGEGGYAGFSAQKTEQKTFGNSSSEVSSTSTPTTKPTTTRKKEDSQSLEKKKHREIANQIFITEPEAPSLEKKKPLKKAKKSSKKVVPPLQQQEEYQPVQQPPKKMGIRGTKKPGKKVTKTEQTSTESNNNNLLELNLIPMSVPEKKESSPTTSSNNTINLLGGIFDSPSNIVSSPTPQPKSDNSSTNLLDFFSQSSPQTLPEPTSVSNLLDFGSSSSDVGVLSPFKSSTFPNWISVGLNNLQKISLPPQASLASFEDKEKCPTSHPSNQEISNDGNVAVSYYSIYKSNELNVLFFVSNLSAQEPVLDLQLEFKVPDSFNVNYLFDSGIEKNEEGVFIPSLPANSCSVIVLNLSFAKHTVNMTVSGKGKYKKGTNKSFKQFIFNIPLTLKDIIRPQLMAVDEFSNNWKQHTHERKTNVPNSSLDNTEKFVNSAKKFLNGTMVKIINSEVLFVGRCITSNKLFLIHAVVGLTLMLTIRTSDAFFTQEITKYCQLVLK
eukprot:TRINITY_DN677_c0_g2_i1.p1 TRINITY_DN677_c0_g2~~TRINITY_DN677_c0_g2_i1.p1  ORF type:complete len:1212 (-),score=405.03 TRINITY_DN677_c0_g2_i1:36-3671(-)